MTSGVRLSRARLALALLALAVLSALFSSSSTRAQETGVVIAAGDSISAGIGSSLPRERGYPALVERWLEQLTGERVVLEVLAEPGETVASFRDDGQLDALLDTLADADASGTRVVAIVLSLGGNELLNLEPAGLSDREQAREDFRAEYFDVLSRIRDSAGPDVPILLVAYYDLTEGDPNATGTDSYWIEEFNNVIRAAAQSVEATFVDLNVSFAGRVNDLTHYPYDVHPNNRGHRQIARDVLTSLGAMSGGPEIEVPEQLDATRLTPTLRFSVASDAGLDSVTAEAESVTLHGPFETEDGEYAVLVDLGPSMDETTITITVIDELGRRDSALVTVTRTSSTGG